MHKSEVSPIYGEFQLKSRHVLRKATAALISTRKERLIYHQKKRSTLSKNCENRQRASAYRFIRQFAYYETARFYH